MIAAALALLVVLALVVLLVLRHTIQPDPHSTRSPVAWLDDALWAQLRLDRMLRRPLVSAPQLVFATDSDRTRAPKWGVGEYATVPPQGRPIYAAQLASVRAQPSIQQPVWPVCCGRLATLTYNQGRGVALATLEDQAGHLDHAFLEEEIRGWGYAQGFADRGWGDILAAMRQGTHNGEGINIFHCRTCGAFYVASCAPS